MVQKPIVVHFCFTVDVEQYLNVHNVCLILSLYFKISPVNITYINMMLNIIKYFLNNEHFSIGNKKKRFGLFTQP